jgi:hypothetical protein
MLSAYRGGGVNVAAEPGEERSESALIGLSEVCSASCLKNKSPTLDGDAKSGAFNAGWTLWKTGRVQINY